VNPELTTLTDEELARRARDGSMASFEELVRRYEARLYRFFAGGCGNAADARDLCQESFIRAYRHLDRFDPSRSFAGWLFTIARHQRIDHFRRMTPSSPAEPPATDTDTPANLLQEREAKEDIWRTARQTLSETAFQVLWLRYAEDMTVSEIARVMKRTQTHIKVILFRARSRLSLELRPPDGSAPAPQPHARERLSGDRLIQHNSVV
jgi:RNA polymerase sigma-70 factor (ECF subfamily)